MTGFLDDGLVEWFANRHTNRAMQERVDYEDAGLLLQKHGLPQHQHDRYKDWDQLLALWHAAKLCRPEDAILDAGANCPSDVLVGMRRLGYMGLVGIGLGMDICRRPEGVYVTGDIIDLEIADDHPKYAFVACISVIEHGVNIAEFMQAMGRIIRSGGHLFVSFDYWEDPIDTGDRRAFGVPVKIFDVNDIAVMLREAMANDLELTSPFHTECKERPVEWLGLSYTFGNMLFRRV